MPSRIRLRPRQTPAPPEADSETLFLDEADGALKSIDSTGTVTTVGEGGGVGGAIPDPATGNVGDVPTVNAAEDAYELTATTKDFYAQDTDPGAVGAGSVWKNTTTGRWWTRNGSDDAWVADVSIDVEAVVDENATVGAQATATGSGAADVSRQAESVGDGNAIAGSRATVSGGTGNAQSINEAIAVDGSADVAGTATTDSGDATAGASALTTTGTAYTALFGQRGATAVALEITITDTVAEMKVTGLPTVDPGVTGQLWIDNDVLKVSSP